MWPTVKQFGTEVKTSLRSHLGSCRVGRREAAPRGRQGPQPRSCRQGAPPGADLPAGAHCAPVGLRRWWWQSHNAALCCCRGAGHFKMVRCVSCEFHLKNTAQDRRPEPVWGTDAGLELFHLSPRPTQPFLCLPRALTCGDALALCPPADSCRDRLGGSVP